MMWLDHLRPKSLCTRTWCQLSCSRPSRVTTHSDHWYIHMVQSWTLLQRCHLHLLLCSSNTCYLQSFIMMHNSHVLLVIHSSSSNSGSFYCLQPFMATHSSSILLKMPSLLWGRAAAVHPAAAGSATFYHLLWYTAAASFGRCSATVLLAAHTTSNGSWWFTMVLWVWGVAQTEAKFNIHC